MSESTEKDTRSEDPPDDSKGSAKQPANREATARTLREALQIPGKRRKLANRAQAGYLLALLVTALSVAVQWAAQFRRNQESYASSIREDLNIYPTILGTATDTDRFRFFKRAGKKVEELASNISKSFLEPPPEIARFPVVPECVLWSYANQAHLSSSEELRQELGQHPSLASTAAPRPDPNYRDALVLWHPHYHRHTATPIDSESDDSGVKDQTRETDCTTLTSDEGPSPEEILRISQLLYYAFVQIPGDTPTEDSFEEGLGEGEIRWGRRPERMHSAAAWPSVAFTYCTIKARPSAFPAVSSANESTGTSVDHSDHLYIGFPGVSLTFDADKESRKDEYDPVATAWYRKSSPKPGRTSSTEEAETTSWTYAYEDPSGAAVITCSAPIYDPQFPNKVIGVVAVDFHAESIARFHGNGTPYIANLVLLFVLCLLMWEILVGGGVWHRFEWIFFSTALVYAFYVFRFFCWMYPPTTSLWENIAAHISIALSMLSSAALFVASVYVFNALAKEEVEGFQPFFGSFEKFMEGHPNLSPVLMVFASTTMVAIAVGLLRLAINHEPVPDVDLTWAGLIDTSFSVIAIITFGVRFSVWLSRLISPWVGYLLFAAFFGYCILQLPETIWAQNPNYWWYIFLMKMVVFGAILVTMYYWTEERNARRIANGRLSLEFLSPLHSPGLLVFFFLGTRKLVLGNAAAAEALGWTTLNPVRDLPGFFEPPRWRSSWDQMFTPGEGARIRDHLRAKAGDERGRQSLTNIRTTLASNTNESVPVNLESIMEWEVQESLRGQFEGRLSVLIARRCVSTEPAGVNEGETFGIEALEMQIKARNWSISDCARWFRVRPSTVRRWLRGGKPSEASLARWRQLVRQRFTGETHDH